MRVLFPRSCTTGRDRLEGKANFRELDLFSRQLVQGRDLGMQAAAAIHPLQLKAIRNALKPTDTQISWVRGINSALPDRAGGLVGVIALGGNMIDAPVIARARRILAQLSEALT